MSEIETDKDGNIVNSSSVSTPKTQPANEILNEVEEVKPIQTPEIRQMDTNQNPVPTTEEIYEEKKKFPIKWICLVIGMIVIAGIVIAWFFSLNSSNYLNGFYIPNYFSIGNLANINLTSFSSFFSSPISTNNFANATSIQSGKIASFSITDSVNADYISYCSRFSPYFVNCYNENVTLGIGVNQST